MPEPRTAFEVLDVSPEAPDREIEAAYHTQAIQAEISGQAIPEEVDAAYYALRDPVNRSKYKELLKRARKRRPLRIPPDQCQAFQEFCEHAHILSREHPAGSGCYYVWLQGQEPPEPVERSERQGPHSMPGAPSTFGQAVGYIVQQLLFWRLFRTSGTFVRLLLLAGYALVLGGLWYAGSRGVEALKLWNARLAQERQVVERQDLHRALVERCDAATSALKDLDLATLKLKSDFETVTGVSFDDAITLKPGRPDAVDTILLRHPTVREAWSDVTRAPPSSAEVASQQERLAQVVERVRSGYVRPDDQQELEQIAKWSRERADLIRSHKTSIEHIQVMLAAEEFERSMQSAEGRTPE